MLPSRVSQARPHQQLCITWATQLNPNYSHAHARFLCNFHVKEQLGFHLNWCFWTAGGNPMKRADGERAKSNKISHWSQTYLCGPLLGLKRGICVAFGWLRVSISTCRWTLSCWMGRSHLLASRFPRPHYQSPLPVLHLRLQSQRSVFWIEDDQWVISNAISCIAYTRVLLFFVFILWPRDTSLLQMQRLSVTFSAN